MKLAAEGTPDTKASVADGLPRADRSTTVQVAW